MRYAIGDIHGNLKTLEALVERLKLTNEDSLYFLGDYIDRGPDSRGVIDYIINLMEDYTVIALRGNHEDFMLKSRNRYYDYNLWMCNGGRQCIDSYSKDWTREAWTEVIPQNHWDFLESLPCLLVEPEYVFCHANLNWFIENPLQSEDESLLWSRDDYYKPELIRNKSLISGHSPTPKNEIEASVLCLTTGPNRIVIDNGCFFAGNVSLRDYVGCRYGELCCLNLDTKELIFQKNIDILISDYAPASG